MKSKKFLYAFAGLVFVGGLAFAFSSTDLFKGSISSSGVDMDLEETDFFVRDLEYQEETDLLSLELCYKGVEPQDALKFEARFSSSVADIDPLDIVVESWSSECYVAQFLRFNNETAGAAFVGDVELELEVFSDMGEELGDDLSNNDYSEVLSFGGEAVEDYDYEGTAYQVLVEGYGLEEGQIEEEMNRLVEEARESRMEEQAFLEALSELAESVRTEAEVDYDYEGTAYQVLVEGYGLEEGRIEEEMNRLVEEARESRMEEQAFLEVLSELAESVRTEEVEDYDYEGTAYQVLVEGYGLDEGRIEEEMNRLVEEARESRMEEQAFLEALSELAESVRTERESEEADASEAEIEAEVEYEYDYEGTARAVLIEGYGLDEGRIEEEMNRLVEEARESRMEEQAFLEALSELAESVRAEEAEEVEMRDEEEHSVEIDLGALETTFSEDEERELEEAIEEAIEEGSLDEADVEDVVEQVEQETSQDDELAEVLAALDAAIAAANSAASSASSAAMAASSAASSAATSGSSSSSGSKDVIVNIDLGDYMSDSGSSSTDASSTTTASSSSSSNEVAEEESPFADVDAGTWYGDAMIALNEEGIMEGSSGKAYPWEYGNRAELVVLVMRAFYDESVLSKMDFEHEFEDVSATKWYAMYLSAAVEFDILEAKDEFRPSDPMSRAEFVTVLVRAANQACVSCDADFTDVSQGDWYYRAIATALAADLVSGYEDGSFKPNSNINRAQVASILYKALEAGWLD